MGCRKRLVLTKSLLGNRDCLVETAKLDQCLTDARKSRIKNGIQRAHANAAFKTPDCFFVLACVFVGPSSSAPCTSIIWITRDRTISKIDGSLVVTVPESGNLPRDPQRILVILVGA